MKNWKSKTSKVEDKMKNAKASFKTFLAVTALFNLSSAIFSVTASADPKDGGTWYTNQRVIDGIGNRNSAQPSQWSSFQYNNKTGTTEKVPVQPSNPADSTNGGFRVPPRSANLTAAELTNLEKFTAARMMSASAPLAVRNMTLEQLNEILKLSEAKNHSYKTIAGARKAVTEILEASKVALADDLVLQAHNLPSFDFSKYKGLQSVATLAERSPATFGMLFTDDFLSGALKLNGNPLNLHQRAGRMVKAMKGKGRTFAVGTLLGAAAMGALAGESKSAAEIANQEGSSAEVQGATTSDFAQRGTGQ